MILFHLILLASVAHASSWFSSEPEYTKWTHAELRTWLEHHSIKVPPSFDKSHLYELVDANWRTPPSPLVEYAEASRQWSLDQYKRAQRVFDHVKDDSFDKWDESRLRAFLLEQGIVAPSGTRDQLVLLVKDRYRAYTNAATLYSSLAAASATSAFASATEAAHSASQFIGSAVAQATHEVARAFDDTADYVYSSWDAHRLRNWLQEHGVVEAKSASTLEELRKLADEYYRTATSATWESWSDSYIREWLISHNLLGPTDKHSRSRLLSEMKKYYYNFTDSIWNTWSDSELKVWLVHHGLLKSDAHRNRDDLVKMVEEHYLTALDSIWGGWTDSDIYEWLSEHGHLEDGNDAKNRKELVDLINSKYPDATQKVALYLVWPDARLRAYLRERGISETALPTTRPGLLQETRIRWVQASARAESNFGRLKEIINNSVEAAEEKLAQILEMLSGHSRDALFEKVDDVHECAKVKSAYAWCWGSHKVDQAQHKVDEAWRFAQKEGHEAVERVGSKKAQGGDEL